MHPGHIQFEGFITGINHPLVAGMNAAQKPQLKPDTQKERPTAATSPSQQIRERAFLLQIRRRLPGGNGRRSRNGTRF